jgi:hypothetical protein
MEITVIRFPAEGEGCSVIARWTPETIGEGSGGWLYRWVYSSSFDDETLEELGLVGDSESAESPSLAEVLSPRWYRYRMASVHPAWKEWFRDRIRAIGEEMTDKDERIQLIRRWHDAVRRSGIWEEQFPEIEAHQKPFPDPA